VHPVSLGMSQTSLPDADGFDVPSHNEARKFASLIRTCIRETASDDAAAKRAGVGKEKFGNALLARWLDRYLFADPQKGMVLNEFPISCRSGQPSCADFVIAGNRGGVPNHIISATDRKIDKFETAVQESKAYSLDAGSFHFTAEEYPILISLPSDRDKIRLDVHFYSPNDKEMLFCTVDEVSFGTLDVSQQVESLARLLQRLHWGVHSLLQLPIPDQPLIVNLLLQDWDSACITYLDTCSGPTSRVMESSGWVFKIFDYDIHPELQPHLDRVRDALGDDYLPDATLIKLAPQIDCLKYRFTELPQLTISTHKLANLALDLVKLHAANLVHGDIRLANILMLEPTAKLIDFDFLGQAGSDVYPSRFSFAVNDGVRHKDAREGQIMLISHDMFAFGGLVQLLARECPDSQMLDWFWNANFLDIDLQDWAATALECSCVTILER